eukprot:CAMPEP_0172873504 /NCGR_PEP_ID=MMETSP1075-20121228/95436_1 /TAXON_ID=2916 /ORGANISM="Ceratium fusus, Strain PA161109" /LENGTH=38 /DNA_ID= /DNA_START= /DNA_END= /DNA_ORIENTATION=
MSLNVVAGLEIAQSLDQLVWQLPLQLGDARIQALDVTA